MSEYSRSTKFTCRRVNQFIATCGHLLNNTYDSNRFKVKPIVYISNLHSGAIFLMVVS